MNNIKDYVLWRGDLSFSSSPFNAVDNLIFSQISYLNFLNIVPYELNSYITLKEAWEEYKRQERKLEHLLLADSIRELTDALVESKRFSDIKLSGYTERFDEKTEKQFAALTINYGKALFVTFRGTDDSLVGWKEDFNLSFMESVPAQREASAYLGRVFKEIPFKPVLLGGHSKGGNLAVYAAINATKMQKKRIKAVFNNDGPGFSESVIKSLKYKETEKKIINILPEGSIVGQLLSHGREDVIIKSKRPMLFQHDPFSWEVMGDDFVLADKLDERSVKLDMLFKKWLSELSNEDRESMVTAIYELAKASEAKTLTEIMNDKMGFLRALGKADKEIKKDVGKSLGKIFEQAAKIMMKK